MFVGVTAIGVGIATAGHLKQLKQKLATEGILKEKWDLFDIDKSGSLNLKELTALLQSFDMDLSKNEIAATYLTLGMCVIYLTSPCVTFLVRNFYSFHLILFLILMIQFLNIVIFK